MLSLKQLARTSKLYLTYGLRNERNRRRIMDVLQDNFKPLFGLGNLVYLLGHKHSYGPMNDLLIQSCKMLHKDRIDMIKESIDFRDTISSYENDLYAITEIIKGGNVTTLYIEQMPDIVEKLMKYLPTVFKEMTNNLKLMGYEDEDIDPITLHMIGPTSFMYVKGVLGDINLKGMEGPTRLLCDQYIKFNKNMPIHQSEIYKRYCRERDVEMAETIKKEINGKCIAIFGAAHYTGIKRELENSSIRTNGKYTQKIMDIFN